MKHDKYHVSMILIVGVIVGTYSAIGPKLAPYVQVQYFRPDFFALRQLYYIKTNAYPISTCSRYGTCIYASTLATFLQITQP